MFNFLLSAADGTALSLGDKLSIGGQVTLLGMGTVFAILALLWGLVELLHVILKPFAEKKTGTFNPPPVVAPAPAVSPAAKNTEKRSDDLELTAVITAQSKRTAERTRRLFASSHSSAQTIGSHLENKIF